MSENLKEPKNIVVLDTTLRDGAQATDVNISQVGALYVAESLASAGVDVIEVGFPVASQSNFDSARKIAETIHGPVLSAFARTSPEDIERAYEAVEPAGNRSRVNVCAPFSDLHIAKRLKTDRESLLKLAVDSTARARSLTDDVEFSFEDSTRTDDEFLVRSVLEIADAGASTIMLPDTVGALTPREYSSKLAKVREALDKHGFDAVKIAAHCHNDLGQGVMNSIDALMYGGAEQVEVTIGGVGERNGNTPLEVVVGAIVVKPELGLSTNVDPTQLRHLTHVVAPRALGVHISERQPFVGKLSYEHGSGLHQDGVAKAPKTFKDFGSSIFGFDKDFTLKLNNQSGKSGVKYELSSLGLEVSHDDLLVITRKMKNLSDSSSGRNVAHNELEEIFSEVTGEQIKDPIALDSFSFSGDKEGLCEATVSVNGNELTMQSEGGVVDAAKKAINELTGLPCEIDGWHVDEKGSGSDATVGVYVTVKQNGYEVMAYDESQISERAGINAYIKAVNTIMRTEERLKASKVQAQNPVVNSMSLNA